MTDTFEEHISLLKKVLTTLLNSGIKIKASKCEFFCQEVKFLGHVIGVDGIKKSPDYMMKIQNYPRSTNTTELRQFLGLVNFHCKFIPNCSVIAKPLSCLTGAPKRKKLEWSTEMNNAYDRLKCELLQDVILSFLDYSKTANKLEMFVDASGTGVGGCLVQQQGDNYRTIAYSSMMFNAAQARYSTIERELCAICWGVRAFHPFIFGVPFVIHTDHKPLLYLQNMANENSRLMRTINELAEYDYIINYRPGQLNGAADAMSKVVKVPVDRESEDLVDCAELPRGLEVSPEVKGGGDSMFISLMYGLRRCKDDCDKDLEIPANHVELRQSAVDLILMRPSYFGLKLDKEKREHIRAMRHPGCIPCEEVLLAVCEMFKLEIWVHYGMKSPVVYTYSKVKSIGNDVSEIPVIHLQCVSGIHFNPVNCRRSRSELWSLINDKYINSPREVESKPVKIEEIEDDMSEYMEGLILCHTVSQACDHELISTLSCVAQVGENKFCTILDTEAQVSLFDRNTYELLSRDTDLRLVDSNGRMVKGIDNSLTKVIGVVELQLSVLDVKMDSYTSFAVVDNGLMPCCCLLGLDFMRDNNFTLDFQNGIIYGVSTSDRLCYPMYQPDQLNGRDEISLQFTISEEYDSEISMDDVNNYKSIKFALSLYDLKLLQSKDFVLRQVKRKITERVPVKNWKNRCLQRFKRFQSKLDVCDDVLYRVIPHLVPVVTFSLLIEIVYKVHIQMAHIGRNKLVHIVSKHYWHPSLERVAGDICNSCVH